MAQKPVKTRKTINLALQGGGAHGAYTWGVLDFLLEDGRIGITGISGTSAGAINAVLLADGYEAGGPDGAREKLASFWEKLSSLGTFSPIQRTPLDRMRGDWSLDFSPGRMMYDSFIRAFSPYEFNPLNVNPLFDLLSAEVDFDRVRHCSKLQLFVCATNVKTGKTKVFKHEEMTAKCVMASSCLPEVYQAVEIDGQHYWDGGFMGNPPLYPLFYHTTCPDVLLVQINPVERNEVPVTARGIHNRLNEITFNATLLRELRMVEFVTRLIDHGKLDPEMYKRINMHSVGPAEEMMELSSSSKLNVELEFLHHLRDLGRKDAELWLEENYDLIGKQSSLNLRAMFE
ncbi:MAG: patatin-like phospholipase family protein [Pseudomonadota bacterium]